MEPTTLGAAGVILVVMLYLDRRRGNATDALREAVTGQGEKIAALTEVVAGHGAQTAALTEVVTGHGEQIAGLRADLSGLSETVVGLRADMNVGFARMGEQVAGQLREFGAESRAEMAAQRDAILQRLDEANSLTNKRIDDSAARTSERFDDTNKRIDDTAAATNARIDDTNGRISDTNESVRNLTTAVVDLSRGLGKPEQTHDAAAEDPVEQPESTSTPVPAAAPAGG